MNGEISKNSILWITDADNTLWDTDLIFRNAQLGLLQLIEDATGFSVGPVDRLAFVREIDQGIAQIDHRGLKYPFGMLVSAIAGRLQSQPPNTAIRQAVLGTDVLPAHITESLVSAFDGMLKELPPLRDGVREGLEILAAAGAKVFVVTEGTRGRIETTLRAHALEGFVETILAAEKNNSLYARLGRARAGTWRWAIGDQIDRDVLPALAAGFQAIHFPGGFMPAWQSGEKVGAKAYFSVDNYLSAVKIAIDFRKTEGHSPIG
ncbi:HAD family hydrolase [Paraburkholderia sp. BR14320]|uniref:HAD family hydrolase n=1 Tax=unclassified Paraburkholderia TaxID=2615204 RepID=UPI0034CF3D7C